MALCKAGFSVNIKLFKFSSELGSVLNRTRPRCHGKGHLGADTATSNACLRRIHTGRESCITRTETNRYNDASHWMFQTAHRIIASSWTSTLTAARGKKTKLTGRNQDEDEGGFTEKMDASEIEAIGGKEMTIHLTGLRLDALLKTAFSTSRVKIEEAVYHNLVRINGKRVTKKSAMVNLGDEVDMIIGENSRNDKFLDVSRVHVTAIHFPKAGTQSSMVVQIRRHKLLTIENYSEKWSSAPSELES